MLCLHSAPDSKDREPGRKAASTSVLSRVLDRLDGTTRVLGSVGGVCVLGGGEAVLPPLGSGWRHFYFRVKSSGLLFFPTVGGTARPSSLYAPKGTWENLFCSYCLSIIIIIISYDHYILCRNHTVFGVNCQKEPQEDPHCPALQVTKTGRPSSSDVIEEHACNRKPRPQTALTATEPSAPLPYGTCSTCSKSERQRNVYLIVLQNSNSHLVCHIPL